MQMKTMLSLFAIVMTMTSVSAKDEPWRDPAVNAINREPARAYSMPLPSEEAAFTGDLEPETPYRKSLNGIWKFHWTGCVLDRPKDFWKVDFDDFTWSTIVVPSCVELQGWGTPNYTNVKYPFPADPPKIPDNDNWASSYRTTFTVPGAWQGRDVFLRFEGVGSAATVWLNGSFVGYTEDSYLPAEFNLTPYLKSGDRNLLAVEVLRRADGSYLEDQDYFRFSGIMRDVSLFAAPKLRLDDFYVRTIPDGSYCNWTLKLETKVHGGKLPVVAKLYDMERRLVGEFANEIMVPNAKVWSAEHPYLYTLVMRVGQDIRATRIGFRETKIEGAVMRINGRPIKFHGVNRHESDPENGRTISVETMRKDVLLFKRYNIDTVRTSHYPDHHSFYDLCDKYGVYVVAEANVEGHGMGYGEKGLGCKPMWKTAIVERNYNHVMNYRNHASVFMWSLGNETGHGDNFREAIKVVKSLDGRPVHWERGNPDADVDSRMYPTVEWLEKRGQLGDGIIDSCEASAWPKENYHTKGKCFFMCEYAHAMGNAMGNFEEYWQAYYAHPSLAGGCIWDWVDQAVWKSDGRGGRFLAYGGDWDDKPNDGPFCCNGVVDPLRNVSAKLLEVAHVHRPIRLICLDAKSGVATLQNWHGFTSADAYAMEWRLIADGIEVANGTGSVPAVSPLSSGEMILPQPDEDVSLTSGAECFYEVSFKLKDDTIWAKKGYVVAREQLPWGKASRCDGSVRCVGKGDWSVEKTDKAITVSGKGTTAVFCRSAGTLVSLVMSGVEILSGEQAGPCFTCVRAFTDNDVWMRKACYDKGLTQLKHTPLSICVEKNAEGVLSIVCKVRVTTPKSAAFDHTTVYRFGDDGVIHVENEITCQGDLPESLPRVGLSLKVNSSLENIMWYGRGPGENYVDRNTSSFIGMWQSTVDAQYVDYVRPQDCGTKTDVRWLSMTDGRGRGFLVVGDAPFIFQALPYAWEDLEFARHREGEVRRNAPLVKHAETYLNLDCAQTGLGGASCGPRPMAKYLVKPAKRQWGYTIKPVGCACPIFGCKADIETLSKMAY